MSVHFLSTVRPIPSAYPFHPPGNPLIEALSQIEYGHLVMITPEGYGLEFTGIKEGPKAFLRLHQWEALDELVARGEIGFVESYVKGQWDTPDLPSLITFALTNSYSLERFFYGKPLYAMWQRLQQLIHGNSLRGSKRNIQMHYDLGNEFYSLWLDKGMTYSGALFEGNDKRTLEVAQRAKYRRILHRLQAQPGQHILEIGCGWGGFAEEAARHGIKVTGITLSPQQACYARERLYCSGLHDLATIELSDYREINGTYDYIVSIGMFEHVGEEYWPTYFRTIRNLLHAEGKAIIQTITLDDYLFESLHKYTGFIERLIFPGGALPSRSRFHATAMKEGLACRDIYTFGQDYALTLHHWLRRFEKNKSEIKALGYDEGFIRLWRFYLASCIASFSVKRTNVMQVEMVYAA